jgi:hypothetical protein
MMLLLLQLLLPLLPLLRTASCPSVVLCELWCLLSVAWSQSKPAPY